jgi:hypothetical protein
MQISISTSVVDRLEKFKPSGLEAKGGNQAGCEFDALLLAGGPTVALRAVKPPGKCPPYSLAFQDRALLLIGIG